MNPTSCPRCVAERRARRLRLVMSVVAMLAIGATIVPCGSCCLMSWAVDVPDAFTVREAIDAEARSSLGALLAVALGCVAGALLARAGRYDRRASTPLPPPDEPTAHYREGPPVECQRHPFAR